jgi:BON domain
MRQRAIWLGSFSVGFASAFLFDPISGNRRRHRLADAAVHLRRQARRAALGIGRDLGKRTRGIIATARQRFRPDPADDVVLEERVHSVLGHIVSHQHAITVRVDDGHVTLDGPIPADQRNKITYAVRTVAGVKEVRTRFNSHIQPAHDPSSNSPTHLVLPRRPPSTRAIIAGSVAALVGAALIRRWVRLSSGS